MIKLEIKYLPADAITPYVNNTRTHSTEQIAQIKASINEFGMCSAIGLHDGTIVYGHARFTALKELGYEYFIQLDDDYTGFNFTTGADAEYTRREASINNLNKVIGIVLDFYKQNKQIHTVSLAQGGDFIGGENSAVFKKKIARKCMNSFICSVSRPFEFLGRINEDVNTYTRQASTGVLMFTIAWIRLEQKQTQSNDGGMTDLYLDGGTYIKSFFSVMYSPSCVKVGSMGVSNRRLHHKVKWKNAVPCIVREATNGN